MVDDVLKVHLSGLANRRRPVLRHHLVFVRRVPQLQMT